MNWTIFPKIFENALTIETGLSDCYNLIVTVLKVKNEKPALKIIRYRDYKNFGSTRFFEKLQLGLTKVNMNSLDLEALKNVLWNF